MAGRDEAVRAAARKHGLSEAAVGVLWDALRRSSGRQAQFSHPELGGMGQWSGGMGQIGDMFNDGLRARVGGACADLSAALADETPAGEPQSRSAQTRGAADPTPPRSSVPPTGAGGFSRPERAANPMTPMAPMNLGPDWWPGDLGRPASSGAQNGVRYAVFPDHNRLAIEREGRVVLYDTGRHRIGGVSQAQSTGSRLSFTSQDGPVDLDELAVVER